MAKQTNRKPVAKDKVVVEKDGKEYVFIVKKAFRDKSNYDRLYFLGERILLSEERLNELVELDFVEKMELE